jgi:hypothetical protein
LTKGARNERMGSESAPTRSKKAVVVASRRKFGLLLGDSCCAQNGRGKCIRKTQDRARA